MFSVCSRRGTCGRRCESRQYRASEGVLAGRFHRLRSDTDVLVHQGYIASISRIENQADALGMLTSLGPKTVEDIQRNLETFHNSYSDTQRALELFMMSARQEGLVNQTSDGKWVILA